MSGMVFEARNELFEYQVNILLPFSSFPSFYGRNCVMAELLFLLINTITVVLWHARLRTHYQGKKTRIGLRTAPSARSRRRLSTGFRSRLRALADH